MRSTYNLPASLTVDLDKLGEQTERFKSGEISALEYRSFRVPQGVYEQRRDGTFMLRVRLPAGGMLPHQMHKLAAVAREFGSGRLHVTTRQDIQVHDVSLDAIHPALVELRTAGLSSKGGGGNTVRNITACADAGVCAQEAFDVTPYAVAVTEFMLGDPVSFQLPRKYKIAFSGCPGDCIGAAVNDLGLVAKREAGGSGFAVYAGGGMGPHARVGQLLEDFVPAEEAHLVAEAVKRVFDKHGNRKNKQRARLRYLVEERGFEAFKELYAKELALLRQTAPPAPEVRPLPERAGQRQQPRGESAPGLAIWREKNVLPQKQRGYCLVRMPLFLGELSPDTLDGLAEVAERYGGGMVRTTPAQGLVMRWVGEDELSGLHHELSALGLAETSSPVLRELIACTGAATCRLGICLSQGLARAIRDELKRVGPDLEDAAGLRLHINGCRNACGRHPLASIGLVGTARRVDGRLVPYYVVQLGGRTGNGQTKLAQGKQEVPARSVPAYVVELLGAFRESGSYPDFDAFLESGGRETAERIAAGHQEVSPFVEDRNYYYDWGAEEPFSLAGRGPGECSAGVFDLIRVDLASACGALEQGKLLSATVLAARAMLITRGEEAKNSADALRLFERHFLHAGLVDGSFRGLIAEARRSTAAKHGVEAFDADPKLVAELIAVVEKLYEDMDQSLRFGPAPISDEAEARDLTKAKAPEPEEIKIDREADFHGVTCPLNYVKTKLLLGQMSKGQVLSVLLDEAGGRSVPQSAKKDGHSILSEQKQGDQWRVIIQKG
jgi:sulfite reductase (ferredoxin)